MSKFFINRPIFAIVIAIMITLIGLLSMVNLPVARYPQISPPSVRVSTMYTGATPQVLNDTVASVIESQIVGVQDLDYMTSDSASTGTYSLSLQFNQGSDPDMDTVNTQNRVQAALAQLPSEVQQVGVTTTKSSGDMAYIFSLNSPNGTFDSHIQHHIFGGIRLLHHRQAFAHVPLAWILAAYDPLAVLGDSPGISASARGICSPGSRGRKCDWTAGRPRRRFGYRADGCGNI